MPTNCGAVAAVRHWTMLAPACTSPSLTALPAQPPTQITLPCLRRCRSWVLLWAVYLARSSHLALAFLLLPAPTWATHSWTRYLTTACTNPVLNTLMLGLCDQVVKVGS